MHNRIIPSFLKTVFYKTKPNAKNICSTTSEFNKNCDIITKRLKERGCPKNLVNDQVDEVKIMESKQLLSTNKRTIPNRIPISITYN